MAHRAPIHLGPSRNSGKATPRRRRSPGARTASARATESGLQPRALAGPGRARPPGWSTSVYASHRQSARWHHARPRGGSRLDGTCPGSRSATRTRRATRSVRGIPRRVYIFRYRTLPATSTPPEPGAAIPRASGQSGPRCSPRARARGWRRAPATWLAAAYSAAVSTPSPAPCIRAGQHQHQTREPAAPRGRARGRAAAGQGRIPAACRTVHLSPDPGGGPAAIGIGFLRLTRGRVRVLARFLHEALLPA